MKNLWYNRENKKPIKNPVFSKHKQRSLFLGAAFLVGSFFIFYNAQAATTYYVSPTGSDTNSGTSTAPFKTIQKCANIVNAGDTCIVKDGTYTDTDGDGNVVKLTRAGTAASNIIFRAENKFGAVLKSATGGNTGLFLSSTAHDVRIEGFEFTGGYAGIFCQGYNVNIRQGYFHDIGRRSYSADIGQMGIYMDDISSSVTVDSSIFHTIGRLADASCGTYCYNHDHGIYAEGQYHKIINNIFYDLTAGWAIQVKKYSGSSITTTGWNISNNTFYGQNNQRAGHIVFDGSVHNITIQNNISYSPLTHFVQSSSNDDSGIVIKNNLVYNAAVMSVSYSGYTISGNITGQDPKFVDLANKDFHLQSTSPAIGKGLLTGAPTYDFDGVTRGSSIDIGAYEYAAGTTPPPPTDTTPPAIPTGLQVQ